MASPSGGTRGGSHIAPPPLLLVAHAAATPWLLQTFPCCKASRGPRGGDATIRAYALLPSKKLTALTLRGFRQRVCPRRSPHRRGVRLRNAGLSHPRLFSSCTPWGQCTFWVYYIWPPCGVTVQWADGLTCRPISGSSRAHVLSHVPLMYMSPTLENGSLTHLLICHLVLSTLVLGGPSGHRAESKGT